MTPCALVLDYSFTLDCLTLGYYFARTIVQSSLNRQPARSPLRRSSNLCYVGLHDANMQSALLSRCIRFGDQAFLLHSLHSTGINLYGPGLLKADDDTNILCMEHLPGYAAVLSAWVNIETAKMQDKWWA